MPVSLLLQLERFPHRQCDRRALPPFAIINLFVLRPGHCDGNDQRACFHRQEGCAIRALLQLALHRLPALRRHRNDTAFCQPIERSADRFSIGPAAMDINDSIGPEERTHQPMFAQFDLAHSIDRPGNGCAQQHGIGIAQMIDHNQGRTRLWKILHSPHRGAHGHEGG
jgi:hypothetical protein